MDKLELYNKLRVVPQDALKKITGGRLSGMTDINPMWRIKNLTEHFGMCGVGWKYEITEKRLEKGCNDEISAFVQINLFVKVDDKWSDAVPGIGGASFVAKEKNGMYQSDECFKMALTDAISVSCKAIGMGADVYFEKDRTKYQQPQQPDPQKKPEPPQQQLSPELDKQLTQAIALIETLTDLDKLKSVWETQPELQGVKVFKDSVNKAKARIKNEKK